MSDTSEPDWLLWSRSLQGIAQTGLAFTRDPYDRERYEALLSLAAEMLSAHTGEPVARITGLFAEQSGYATPKIDVRAAVFDAAGRILLVREAMDEDRWTLPGGWADVNVTPAENAVKEVVEESGYQARVVKLAAVWDRARQGHLPTVFSCCKLFYVCALVGGAARTSLETTEVAWFGRDEIPADLSSGRVLPRQIERMFEHAAHPELPTDFE